MSEKKEADRLPEHPDVEDKKVDGIEIQDVGEVQEAQSPNSTESLAEKVEQPLEKLADDQQKPKKKGKDNTTGGDKGEP